MDLTDLNEEEKHAVLVVESMHFEDLRLAIVHLSEKLTEREQRIRNREFWGTVERIKK